MQVGGAPKPDGAKEEEEFWTLGQKHPYFNSQTRGFAVLSRNVGFFPQRALAHNFSKRSKKSGKVLATQPGSRISRPGLRSAVMAKLIAMR